MTEEQNEAEDGLAPLIERFRLCVEKGWSSCIVGTADMERVLEALSTKPPAIPDVEAVAAEARSKALEEAAKVAETWGDRFDSGDLDCEAHGAWKAATAIRTLIDNKDITS